jgi:multisubunit Na+/H+ antiporter MnhG subunit
VIRTAAADILLGCAVLVVAASALGVLAMPDASTRLHFVSPAAVVAPVLVTLAILVRSGLDLSTGESCVTLAFMVFAGPYLSHATIRAIRVRERGDWRPTGPRRDGEKAP